MYRSSFIFLVTQSYNITGKTNLNYIQNCVIVDEGATPIRTVPLRSMILFAVRQFCYRQNDRRLCSFINNGPSSGKFITFCLFCLEAWQSKQILKQHEIVCQKRVNCLMSASDVQSTFLAEILSVCKLLNIWHLIKHKSS